MDEGQAVKDLNEKGFLSPAVELFRERVRETYQKSFMEVEILSETAQCLMMGAGADLNKPHMVASLVYLQRTVRSCQAAIILCERGLVVDAQTVTRSAVEALFHGVALINDPGVFVRIAREGDIAEKKQAEAMIKTFSGGLADQQVADLGEVISRADGKAAGFTVFDAARIADLMPIYDTLYRGLSTVASHATFRSMDSSFLMKEDQPALITGPTEYHLDFTLGLLKVVLDVSSSKLRDNFEFEA